MAYFVEFLEYILLFIKNSEFDLVLSYFVAIICFCAGSISYTLVLNDSWQASFPTIFIASTWSRGQMTVECVLFKWCRSIWHTRLYDFSIPPSATNTRTFLNERKILNSEKNFDPFGSCISGYKTQLLIYKLYLYAIKTWNSRVNQDKLAICIYMQYCFRSFASKIF